MNQDRRKKSLGRGSRRTIKQERLKIKDGGRDRKGENVHHAKGKEPVEMLQAIVNVIEESHKEYEREFLDAGYWARRMTEREWIVNHIAGQLRSHNGFALAELPYQHSPSFLAERAKWETRRARRQ